jgi:GT2 family glycosyltransferase
MMPYDHSLSGPRPAGPGPRRPAPEPGVSVVIPVRGRVAQLCATLASLGEAARLSPEPVEVLVVDDSAPADALRHRRNCARFGARYLRGPRHVGAKRNLGVTRARYDLLFFTDSDCRPAADSIDRHVRRLRAPDDVAAVAGPTFVEASDTVLFRVMRESQLLNGDLERPSRDARLAWATTSNLAVRRSVFEAVGGFPERSLTVVGGEDVDLGLRLTRRGYAIVSEPEATVTHDRASTASLPTVVRRLFHYGRSEQWLADRYPQHRAPRWNPVTALALTAVAATAMRSRRGLVAVPVAAAALLAADAWRHRSDRSARGYADATARRLVEWSFDAGATAAAVQLRRPGLLFAGFAAPSPEAGLAY